MAGVFASFPDIFSMMTEFDEHPWLFASLASLLVGLSGILPLLIIPIDSSAAFEDGPGAATLRILLSFAVGGLLGDVFLHLLPEAWANDVANSSHGHVSLRSGLWCLLGMLVFIVVEKLFATEGHDDDDKQEHKHNGTVQQIEIEEIEKLLEKERKFRGKGNGESLCGNGTVTAKQLFDSCVFNNNTKGEGVCCSSMATNGAVKCNVPGGAGGAGSGAAVGGRWMGRCLLREAREQAQRASKEKQNDKKHVAGYLNLMANSIDNFTHGLAVGGSFLVGFRVGLLTTFAILVHEIPHEIGDFAILLKSGFSRWEAAKAQLATASAGLIGAMSALAFSGASNSIEAKTSWIVPFTAGGFLHIALVVVLPELLREQDKLQSLQHLAALATGIATMAAMTYYF